MKILPLKQGKNTLKAQRWKHKVSKFIIEDAQTQPMVTLIEKDNWRAFTVRYAVNFKKRRATKNILFLKILKAIEAKGSEIKFASATFHWVEAPEIKITLTK